MMCPSAFFLRPESSPTDTRSTSYGESTSATCSLPLGLNGFGSLNTGFSSGSSGTWHDAHPIEENSASPRSDAARASGFSDSTLTGTGSVAWNITSAVMSPLDSSSALPSASWSIASPNRSDACIPKCWFIAFTANSRSETIVPFCMNGLTIRSVSTPSSSSMPMVPSGRAVILPNPTPFDHSSIVTSPPLFDASRLASSRVACRSDVISRASSSITPDPNRPSDVRSFPTVFSVCDFIPSPSLPSKLTNASRSASTNTLVALSPPPPIRGTP